MSALQVIELFAGFNPNQEPVVERLPVKVLEDDSCQLVKSPAFVKGIASGDVIRLQKGTREFTLVKRAGNLAVRVFTKSDNEAIAELLTSKLEKLGGELDHESPRMLIYTIHVSCGFTQIEAILNEACDGQTAAWIYGNVYDPVDGTTPLNWWQEILKPE